MPDHPEAIVAGKKRPFTGAEFLESLRDGREVYIYGERVGDVTTHPAFRNSAASVALLYDALHDKAHKDTLTAPTPVVTENLNVQPTYITGTVDVSSKRTFLISGYVNTSHGKVTTTVLQTVNFTNNQYFDITASKYVQNISQATTVSSYTTVSQPGTASTVYTQSYYFPLTVDYTEDTLSDGDLGATTKADQTYQLTTSTTQSGRITYNSTLINAGQHVDTLDYITGLNSNQSASQQYNSYDSTGAAYDCAISAVANVLTAFSPGARSKKS